ncbi:hypothetical protein [Streptomyces griseus]|uniref:hypothetical protein n=1 Tax=Streptomyces griseus TaxID=1911 RepID=UPI0004C97398|nr:hypothetical protein [Streptomyces griseus]
MKKRSMLAIASLAAGVVTALVTPPPQASAADTPLGLGGATGLLQEDSAASTLHETVTTVEGTVADSSAQGLR